MTNHIIMINEEEWYFQISEDEKEMQAGIVFNTGFCPIHTIEYDELLSEYDNLENLVEHVEMKEGN